MFRAVLTCRSDLFEEVPQEVHFSLANVSIDLLHAATKGKSQWFRKAPMKLTLSESGVTLYDEESFVLFAMDSAAKEQWCVSKLALMLCWWP